MSLSAISNKVTSKVGRQILVTQKHSPTLLFVTGVVGLGATVVLASRATLKMDEILREAEENSSRISEAMAIGDEKYTKEDHDKDVVLNKTQLTIKVVKLYAPAFACGVITVGAFTGSHIILNRRNAAITAAYTAVDKGFKDYRKRVVEAYGPAKDEEFRYGVVEREIAVDTDEGVTVKTVRELDKREGNVPSIYARVFDESSKNWSRTPHQNQFFIQSIQNYANDRLRGVGHVFLNEVYDMLGLERSPEGQIVGWVKGNGDDFIDFGVFRGDTYMAQQFVNGSERSIWLDFNVDGPVWDKI
jgi:hypothetical protein